MSEAIQILKALRDKVSDERLGDEILTGIDMCIIKLENEMPNDRYLQDIR